MAVKFRVNKTPHSIAKRKTVVNSSTREVGQPKICSHCGSEIWELKVTHKISVDLSEEKSNNAIRLGTVSQCSEGIYCALCGKKAKKFNNEGIRSMSIFSNMKRALGVPV